MNHFSLHKIPLLHRKNPSKQLVELINAEVFLLCDEISEASCGIDVRLRKLDDNSDFSTHLECNNITL